MWLCIPVLVYLLAAVRNEHWSTLAWEAGGPGVNQVIVDTINFFWGGCHSHGMWDLSSLTSSGTGAPCPGSTES